jgi:regulation of enolase protein 1 (concanavalin A-like superfamily)
MATDGDKIAAYGWVKMGIEFHEGRANLSTVATHPSSSSDWSLVPLARGAVSVTIEVERETKDETGVYGGSLWVYLVKEDGRRTGVREVTWAFTKPTLELGAISLGVYAARPTKTANGGEGVLEVSYSNFKIDA